MGFQSFFTRRKRPHRGGLIRKPVAPRKPITTRRIVTTRRPVTTRKPVTTKRPVTTKKAVTTRAPPKTTKKPATTKPPAPTPGGKCSAKKPCMAGEKCVSGTCKPDPTAQCPPGEHHNGTACVTGAPPACPPGREYVAGKCIKACKKGLKRVGNTCESDPDAVCGEGKINDPKKGCISDGSTPPGGMGGILAGTFAGNAALAAQAAAAAALTAGLSSAEGAAIQGVLGKFNSAYDSSTALFTARQVALEDQLSSLEFPLPSEAAQNAIIDEQLQKPVPGSTAKIKIWGTT